MKTGNTVQAKDEKGGFVRQASSFRTALIGRKLKGLDEAISISLVEPVLTNEGWRFGDYPGARRFR
jgi:putative glutathione S-transferase